MSEFWALVLGAALATLGGILGTWFSEIMKNREKKRENKRAAYLKLINLCNILLTSDMVDVRDYYNEICEGLTYAKLYASPEVKSAFIAVFDCVDDNGYLGTDGKETIKALITVMVAYMKQELKIEDSDSKELLKELKENETAGVGTDAN